MEIGNYLLAFGSDRSVVNKWLLQGLKKLEVDLLNVGEDDIAELLALGIDIRKDDRFISANLLSREGGEPLLRPFSIKLIPVPGTEKKLRMGFLGLSTRAANPSGEKSPYLWGDPLAAAAKWIPTLRQQCDFLVVIACMPSRDAVQLAINHAEIDAILDGYKHQFSSPVATINKAKIFYSEDEGRTLGEVRFLVKRGENMEATALNNILTSNIQDDPEMLAFVNQAKREILAAQGGSGSSAAPSVPAGDAIPARFLTAQKCAACHPRQFALWAGSKHAHAMEALTQAKKEFDAGCVPCHVTGSGQAGGFIELSRTPALANVQCESCHGAGMDHARNPGLAKMAPIGEAACLPCHTKSNSPEFQFAPYWKKVAH